MPEASRIYWDACVFLSYVNEYPDRVGDIESLLAEAERDEVELVTSTASIVEVAFGATEQQGRALDAETELKINSLWEPAAPVKLVEFHRLIAQEAQALMRSGIPEGWSLKPMDAIHLCTARRMNADAFHTYDDKLDKWSARVGFPVVRPNPTSPQLS
jgi:predicted nucleic acid-binding protein